MPHHCCGLDFVSWQSVRSHVSSHPSHKDCRRCRKGFPASGPFKQHMRNSEYHTRGEPTYHLDLMSHMGQASPLLGRGLISEQATPVSTLAAPKLYSGIPASMVKPVFMAACRLRFSEPTVEGLVRSTGTTLDRQVVGAILEGALRLLPTDNSPEGQSSRKTKMAVKAAQALEAETQFVSQIQKFQPRSIGEKEQRENIRRASEAGSVEVVRSTPDMLFSESTSLCGSDINWLEYKNMFGFKSNPFVHKKNKAQLRRYVETFGSGMVVYKLGYESNHLIIDGLKVMREADVMQWLRSQVAS